MSKAAMLSKKAVEFFAYQNGVDLQIAEREVVLTHALQLLGDAGQLDRLAFKGGTCIRKVHLGKTGRFSMDLDFTACESMALDDLILDLMGVFNRTYQRIEFALDNKWRKTQGDLSITVQPTFRHEWNEKGQFDIQVSFREVPTLAPTTHKQLEQAYFKDLPFSPVPLRCLCLTKVLSEKVRAAYQRAKVRDLHDLFVFSTKAVDRPLLRRLVVIKLWQARDPFDPFILFDRLQNGKYDWGDLKQLLRATEKLDPKQIIGQCLSSYRFLGNLTDDERALAEDSKAHKKVALWETLVKSCREKAKPGEF